MSLPQNRLKWLHKEWWRCYDRLALKSNNKDQREIKRFGFEGQNRTKTKTSADVRKRRQWWECCSWHKKGQVRNRNDRSMEQLCLKTIIFRSLTTYSSLLYKLPDSVNTANPPAIMRPTRIVRDLNKWLKLSLVIFAFKYSIKLKIWHKPNTPRDWKYY